MGQEAKQPNLKENENSDQEFYDNYNSNCECSWLTANGDALFVTPSCPPMQ